MRVSKAVPRVVLAGLGLLLLTLFAQNAKADTIDFACGGSYACTGTVVQSGLTYSTLGVGVTSSYESDPFTLTFNTNTGVVTIAENGGPDVFTGTITNLSSSSGGGLTTLDLGVNWTAIPPGFGNQGSTPFPAGSVVSITITGNALSVDIPILTPEPAVPALLSTGMIALGLLFRRKAGVLA